MKSKTIRVVKTTTESGADYITAKFKTREEASVWESQKREKFNFNLWVEKFSY